MSDKPDIWVLAVRDILAGLQAVRRTHPEAIPLNAEVSAIKSLRIRTPDRDDGE